MLAREALVNAKIIEIARSSSLWRADDMPSYKLCLFQIEMFLFPVTFGLFVDPKCVGPEATEGEGGMLYLINCSRGQNTEGVCADEVQRAGVFR